ncbi:hypothetical protein GQX74_000348 [Glossina fuscipes]|nr:hypothetical protein GQX74_000348 [Glossina fuscipes]
MGQNPQTQNASRLTTLRQKSDVKIIVFTITLLSNMSQQKVRHHVHQKTISILTAGPTEQNRCKPDFFWGPGQILHGLSMFIGMIQLLIGTIPMQGKRLKATGNLNDYLTGVDLCLSLFFEEQYCARPTEHKSSWCPSTWLKSLAIPLAPLGFATILWKW